MCGRVVQRVAGLQLGEPGKPVRDPGQRLGRQALSELPGHRDESGAVLPVATSRLLVLPPVPLAVADFLLHPVLGAGDDLLAGDRPAGGRAPADASRRDRALVVGAAVGLGRDDGYIDGQEQSCYDGKSFGPFDERAFHGGPFAVAISALGLCESGGTPCWNLV